MRVDRLVAKFDIQIRYTQFPLHPDTPPEGLTLEQLFAGRGIDIPAAQARMRQLMAAEGLPYGERTMTFNSRLAQELAKWAESQPNGATTHDALFRAYFVDGVNIGRLDNLVAVAAQVGLDERQARDVLQSRHMRPSVDDDWRRSGELGVTAVPTFAAGRRIIVGAQPYEILERTLVEAGAFRRSNSAG